MAYINVDEVYILDNTGLQVDQTTDLPFKDAGLTESQQAQARANIGAGATNPNLLDNPWFTVNQRGTSGTISADGVYVSDRWQKKGLGSCTVNNDGTLTCVGGTGTAYVQLRQGHSAEYMASLVGKPITMSVMWSDGTVFTANFTSVSANVQNIVYITNGGSYVCIDERSGVNHIFVLIINETRTIKSVKLEIGTVSTLVNDTPPDYGTELRKCLRYYYRITGVTFLDLGAALAESATAWLLRFPLPVPMRVAPTTTTSGNFVLWNGAVGNACSAISTHTSVTPPTNPAYVAIQGTSSGMTTGNRYNIQARNQASAYIEFSADL